jgi:hypothetical protein
VRIVDPLSDDHPDNIQWTVQDLLRNMIEEPDWFHMSGYDVVLMAPDCTEFAVSGARWWAGKDPALLERAVDNVVTAWAIKDAVNPKVWAAENPVGRMRRIVLEKRGVDIGKWTRTFDPNDFAGWADAPDADAYTKRTCLWGEFNELTEDRRNITHRKGSSPIHRAPPSEDRWRFRSVTPQGFARAFYAANNW